MGTQSLAPAMLVALVAGSWIAAARAQTAEPSDTNVPAAGAPTPAKGIVPLLDYSGEFWSRPRLSGDWGGTRTDLANKGVTLNLDWTQVGQTVVSGGRRIDWDYGGSFDATLTLDLQRMGVIPGGVLKMRVESRYGESVNDDSGSILPVNTDAFFPLTKRINDGIVSVTELNYLQYLSETFGLTFGKFQTLDGDPNEFASGRGRSQFMNANFVFNSITALTVPYSTLGGGILWAPTGQILVSSVVVSTQDSSTTSGFENLNQGWTWSTEADFQYRLGSLPGGFNVGAIYAFDGDFSEIGGKLQLIAGQGLAFPKKSESWGMYASAWQYLFTMDPAPEKITVTDGRPDIRGLGLFARFGLADKTTNPVNWSISGGIAGRGLIPSRDNDSLGIGYCYNNLHDPRPLLSRQLESSTQAFEAFYNIAITPAVGLTLDVQWVGGALKNVDSATLLGARLDVQF